MKKVLVVMSHQISQDQIDDFGGEVITLKEINPELQRMCSQIPARAETVYIRVLAFELVVTAQREKCSHIAVMGEPTLVTHTVLECLNLHIIPITSTSERVSVDSPQTDGSVIKTSVFKHVQWRNMI